MATIVKDLNTNVSAVQGVISLYSLIIFGLLLIMFLLSTFLPRRKEREIAPAERVPDVVEEVVA